MFDEDRHTNGCAGADDFERTRDSELSGRPWLLDDLEKFSAIWHNDPFPYKKAVVFVDNAGADVVLGILPLVREMLRKGVQVRMTVLGKHGPRVLCLRARERAKPHWTSGLSTTFLESNTAFFHV